tara:strand:+ start:176 stop:601 length:426 start_codon:yes stop_codon:yes gene_type:complete
MKKISDIIFSENAEFFIRFAFGLITALILLSASLFGQTTFTDEEMINLENDFIYLENMVDSLSYQDSLKALMIETLKIEVDLSNKEIELLDEQLALTEKKVKLVKPSWFENKWLYFGYGATLGVTVTLLINQLSDSINIFD